jgi:hypothetical protein
MKSILIANIIYFIHILLVLFILTGIFYIPHKYLPFFIFFVIIIILAWNNVFGACILTQLEYYFRTGIWSNLSAEDENGPEFFRPLLKLITGQELTRETSNKINHIMFISVIIFSIIKYFNKSL